MKNEGFIRTASAHCTTNSSSFILHSSLIFRIFVKNIRSTMATIKIKQIRSRIGSPKDQKRTLDALGLRKINQIVEHEETPSVLGMVNKVKHLVAILEDAPIKYVNRKIGKKANKTACPILKKLNSYNMKEYKVLNLTIYKSNYPVELEDKYRNNYQNYCWILLENLHTLHMIS